MHMRVDIVADSQDSDPGFVGERLLDRYGADLRLRDRDQLRAGDTSQADLILLLGSARSAREPEHTAVVHAESELVRSALDSGTPVLGICYGAQLLAHALGGQITVCSQPEIGWYKLTSQDPTLCPPGPWTQFHSDALVAPPLARVLGTSPAGCQAFADESRGARALGWQFHPEVTTKRFSTWVERLHTYCERHGADPDQLIAAAPQHEAALRQAAYALTDAAITWLQEPRRTRAAAESGR